MKAGQRVTVLGAGRSGRSAAAVAARLGAEVTLTDLREDLEPLEGVRCVFGRHEEADLVGADLVVVSPGVPAAAPPVQRALGGGVEVVGELGFAASLLPDEVPVVAVTGTNGKSTVTAFTGQLLAAAGWRCFVGGNLGTPLSDAVGGDWQALVVEVSSYQMELPGSFTCDVAAILNLSPDHLARHGTLEVYGEHKCRLLDRLRPGGLGVLPVGGGLLQRLAEGRGPRRAWIGAHPGVIVEGDVARLEDGEVDLSGLAAPGGLNRQNAAVACLMAQTVGLPLDAMDPAALQPLPHRMERVGAWGGVTWIDDSKATNVEATAAGLSGISGPFVALLGGAGKDGADYTSLTPMLAGARAVLCFGASGTEIAAALSGSSPERLPELEDAVRRARELAQPGDSVVLSPACASFDAFTDFTHRGRVFARLADPGSPS